jgi:hypothetical protein
VLVDAVGKFISRSAEARDENRKRGQKNWN